MKNPFIAMALMAAALGQGLIRGVHRTPRFTRRKPSRFKWRTSHHTPHQGAQERLRRVLGGWAGNYIYDEAGKRHRVSKNEMLGPVGPRRHEAAAVLLQKFREKGMTA